MSNLFFNLSLTRVLKLNTITVILITYILLHSTAASNQNSTVIPLLEKKNALSQSLDSLNLLRQSNKREGRSFSEIEFKHKQIIDSLQLIRKIIQTDIAETSRLSDNKNHFPLFRLLCLSDWVILLIVAALLFAGILLLLKVVKNVLFNSSKNKASNKPAKLRPLASNPPNSLLSKELSGHNDFAKSQIMNDDQIHFEYSERNSDQLDDKNDEDLETNVIKAASEGMSIQELSRNFHLSSDHITLILKLAESDHYRQKR